MIPVHQTILADPTRNDGHDATGQPGNCYQAAIASALGAGPSPRGPFRHVVVLDPKTGAMIHDPHPSGAGVTEVDEVELILALDGGEQ